MTNDSKASKSAPVTAPATSIVAVAETLPASRIIPALVGSKGSYEKTLERGVTYGIACATPSGQKVLPFRFDGAGTVAVTVMATGVAWVGRNGAELDAIVFHGQNGAIVAQPWSGKSGDAGYKINPYPVGGQAKIRCVRMEGVATA